ncbi:TPA: hypothetical protein vir323_00036 [Caudoviricetes sp. vir323]|uniref:Uncharacterized protein n=1 Tax=Caudoviricetes sp. vir323 TaxID=3068356 RepID=A0AA86XMJ4_9CAUD|nr:TPA_asm: hypothetical protein vir323_00036 [Caudoviricetes sp. vir323]
MAGSAKLNEEYELNYSANTVFNCLIESLPRTKIVRAHPVIEEINQNDMEIKCITPGYKTQITVVAISENKSIIKFFLKPLSIGQIIDLWNRNKKNVKAIMDQLLNDINNYDGSSDVSSKEFADDNSAVEKEVISNESKQNNVNKNSSLIDKLFYWSNEDGTVRLAKTKIISISFFILLVIWDQIASTSDILTSMIIALIFSIPVFIVGFLIHYLISR